MKRLRSMFSWAHLLGPVVAVAFAATAANAATLTDDFSDPWPYESVGDVAGYDPLATSGTGIWQGIHNVANLGGGRLNANIDAANELIVDDNNTVNVGWEGGRSTAPCALHPGRRQQGFHRHHQNQLANERFLVGRGLGGPCCQLADAAGCWYG